MIVYLIIIILIIIYFYGKRNHDYWSKINVMYIPPVPIFGNYLKILLGFENMNILTSKSYNKHPHEAVVGQFCGNTPELVIRDPEIVRDILNVHFTHFYNRIQGRDFNKEPLHKNVFTVEGDIWKLLRQRLTPAFTTAKLKTMFPTLVKCADKLNGVGNEIVAHGGECDVRELMARFSTDFIGAYGLGIEMDTITNENSIFREMGKEIFKRSFRDIFFMTLYDVLPETRKMYKILNKSVDKFFIDIITRVFEQRNFKPSGKNDFVDLILDTAAKGKIKGTSIEHTNSDGTPKEVELEMDLMCMIAQVLVMFGAGFETSSSATSYLLHELAYHPDIQRKIQKEIDEVLLKYDNKLCYEAIAEMTLLDLALKETLRLHSPAGILIRYCVRQYTISKLDIRIDPGVRVIIPVDSLHKDEKYYNNPEEFRPERFANEKSFRSNYVYMPFGEGPRNCIGARMGHVLSMAGVAPLLRKFSVVPSVTSSRKLMMDPRLTIQTPKDGIPLKLISRKTDIK